MAKLPPPPARFLMHHPAHLIACGFGSGLSRWAPGTAGTAFAWLAYASWEWLVLVNTPEANIRVDLLLILPLVALATLWPVVRAMLPSRDANQAAPPRFPHE